MNNIINREKIGEGIYFSHITDHRYKINRISINFFTTLSDKASVNALIPRLLSGSNSDYPDRKLLNEKKASLYSAKVGFNISSMGDSQQLEIFAVSIDNKYAFEQENVTDEVTEILLDCVFSPVMEEGAFTKDPLSEEKKALAETIEAELNDKRVYSRKRLYEALCKGEPASLNPQGKSDAAREITPKGAAEAYFSLIKSAPIEIFAIGCNDFNSIGEKLKRAFSNIERGDIEKCISVPSPISRKVMEKEEKMPVSQSKMVLGYKTKNRNYPAITLMTMIFGGMTSSKLFSNVREKMSLCYYCWASFARDKCVMIVDCGVDGENIKKAKNAISVQLKSVADGDFTDTDIETAKLTIANTVNSFNDSPGSMTNWYISRIYRGDIKSPEESLSEYDGVTKEDIMAAAKDMVLDTVYVLAGES
ncbi:MAG: insulinase family protein [Eubacterium sp.]|jgi:predicted Zn-dependent peptidase|nr:insulinase family protein [Eubacterium sp.]